MQQEKNVNLKTCKDCQKTSDEVIFRKGLICKNCENFKIVMYRKSNPESFLKKKYNDMKRRVEGKHEPKKRHLYMGKEILPQSIFLEWSRNHKDFLQLFDHWKNNNFDRKLTPSINRLNNDFGYNLQNMEWITNSENCALTSRVKKVIK